MKNTLWQTFEEYALSKQETYAIRGGGEYLNRQIFTLLCEEMNYTTPIMEWQHADYRYWAYQVGVSINTLKRWLIEGKNPQKSAQKYILEKLNYSTWQELEQDIILKKT